MPENSKSVDAPDVIVVGVDGTAASVNATRYALAEAARGGVGLEVVHVVPDIPVADFYALSPDELMTAGRSVVQTVLDQVGPTPDGVPCHTRVERGPVAATLADAGRNARSLVVGSDRRSVSMRLLTGNVSTSVAARCAAPVVSVPETWRGDQPTGAVLAGVRNPHRSQSLMAEAFAVARERSSRLVVLHAWQFGEAYDDLIAADRELFEEWQGRARRDLEELVAPWRQRCSDVEVECCTVHAQGAQALVEASAHADEMVILRGAHRLPAMTHLGPTARAVLLHAHCPVRVVPSGHVPVMPVAAPEAAGARAS